MIVSYMYKMKDHIDIMIKSLTGLDTSFVTGLLIKLLLAVFFVIIAFLLEFAKILVSPALFIAYPFIGIRLLGGDEDYSIRKSLDAVQSGDLFNFIYHYVY